jgi:Fe2+ transport system protein FeoA
LRHLGVQPGQQIEVLVRALVGETFLSNDREVVALLQQPSAWSASGVRSL